MSTPKKCDQPPTSTELCRSSVSSVGDYCVGQRASPAVPIRPAFTKPTQSSGTPHTSTGSNLPPQ